MPQPAPPPRSASAPPPARLDHQCGHQRRYVRRRGVVRRAAGLPGRPIRGRPLLGGQCGRCARPGRIGPPRHVRTRSGETRQLVQRELGQQLRQPGELRDRPLAGPATRQVRLEGAQVVRVERAQDIGSGIEPVRVGQAVTPLSSSASFSALIA